MAATGELSRYALKHVEGLERGLLAGPGEAVGSGSYGTVCVVKVRGRRYIAKRLHTVLLDEHQVDKVQRDAVMERFRAECLLLSRLRHPNIVRFVGIHEGRGPSNFALIMERMDIDLEKALAKHPNIPLSTKLHILLNVSYGLLYLHSQTPPIIHRDLTAPNVLLSADLSWAKIADLGVSKILDVDPQELARQTKCPGALAYMAPEALMPNPVYDERLDVFSFGQLTLFTVNQEFPQPYELGPDSHSAVKKEKAQICKRRIAIDKMGKSHCLYEIVTQCLHDNAKKRPTTVSINAFLDDLRSEHPSLQQKELVDLREREARAVEEKETLEREMREKEAKLATLENDQSQMLVKFKKLSDHVVEMGLSLETCTKQRDELLVQLEVVKAQVAVYKDDFEVERRDRERSASHLDEMQQEHDAREAELTRVCGERKKEEEEYQQRLEQQQVLIKSLEAGKKELEQSLQHLGSELLQNGGDLDASIDDSLHLKREGAGGEDGGGGGERGEEGGEGGGGEGRRGGGEEEEGEGGGGEGRGGGEEEEGEEGGREKKESNNKKRKKRWRLASFSSSRSRASTFFVAGSKRGRERKREVAVTKSLSSDFATVYPDSSLASDSATVDLESLERELDRCRAENEELRVSMQQLQLEFVAAQLPPGQTRDQPLAISPAPPSRSSSPHSSPASRSGLPSSSPPPPVGSHFISGLQTSSPSSQVEPPVPEPFHDLATPTTAEEW